MRTLKGKVLFITGASRGIGKAIALRAARDGAMVVIASKTATTHPKLPGTIYETAKEVELIGGKALPLAVDIRYVEQINSAVEEAAKTFGGIDILVNNASAIFLNDCVNLTAKQYNLMHEVNVRGTYFCAQACLPHLKRSANPHVLNMSPPISMQPRFFSQHAGYTASKFAMSMCVLGMAAEFFRDGIAVNALWPKTLINTSALQAIFTDPAQLKEIQNKSRHPSIVADAAHYILNQPSTFTGKFLLDEKVLQDAGVKDFSVYAVKTGSELLPDLFVD